jgi:hypothetical protein
MCGDHGGLAVEEELNALHGLQDLPNASNYWVGPNYLIGV